MVIKWLTGWTYLYVDVENPGENPRKMFRIYVGLQEGNSKLEFNHI